MKSTLTYLNPFTLYNNQYSFRIKTEAVFEENKPYIFDFFILDDFILEEFFVFKNLWRETILLNSFQDPKVAKISKFGQLPNRIIYRQVEEVKGITLEEYL